MLAEEADAAYDRVALTGYTELWDRSRLALAGNDYAGDGHVVVLLRDPSTRINRTHKSVTTLLGRHISYDALVLATGSYAFVPPVPVHGASKRASDPLGEVAHHVEASCRAGAVGHQHPIHRTAVSGGR